MGLGDTVAVATRSQAWTLDNMGNWSALADDGQAAVRRTHNKQNQVTQVGTTNLTFDNNGNQMIDETGKLFYYDAWNS